MKLIKKFIVLSLITTVALYATFFYINKYILSNDRIRFQSKKVDMTKVDMNIPINIPTSAKNIKVSYDGSYVAYDDNEILNIMDVKSGIKKEINLDNSVSFYSWIPDRNRILIIENVDRNYSRVFKLDYYDADKAETGNISKFNASAATMEIKLLRVSTITNSIYMKAEDDKGRAKIYYLNIMEKLKKVKMKSSDIGNIEVIPNKSSMAYEDNINGKIYVTNITKPLVIKGVISQNLLGIDNEDNVYIGENVGNKITKIYTGALDAAIVRWYPYVLSAPVDKTDIYISKVGGIYVNDALKNTIFKVKSNKYISYPGKLIQVIDDAIISINQGKLTITMLKGL